MSIHLSYQFFIAFPLLSLIFLLYVMINKAKVFFLNYYLYICLNSFNLHVMCTVTGYKTLFGKKNVP